MKKLKSIIMVLVMLSMVFVSACSKESKEDEPTKTFVGVAIYQNISSNKNYSKVQANANYINKIISTEDDKILYDEEPASLFYIYNPSGITSELNKNSFISNTENIINLKDNVLDITMERILEASDVLIFSIYKNDKDSYSLELISEEDINQTSQSFEFDFSHDKFNKIKLTLKTNMTTNEKY